MVKEPVYSRKAGDKYQVDCSMDGEKYCEMMVQTNGGLAAVKKYFKDSGLEWIEIQEDGAPGHGYDNHTWPPSRTEDHKTLDKAAKTYRIRFRKQAGHCPSHNALDQAVWTHLASRVRKRVNEFKEQMPKDKLLDLLWTIIEEEFWAMDPEILDDCFWSKDEAAKDTIRLKGWSKGKQEHSQVRATKKKWLESMGWKRIPHELPRHWPTSPTTPTRKATGTIPAARSRCRAPRAAPPPAFE